MVRPGSIERLEEVVVERGEDISANLGLQVLGDDLLEAAVLANVMKLF